MFYSIKSKIEKELSSYIRNLDSLYRLQKISPLLFNNIKDFLLRKGKRIRPTLFVIGYLGFAKKETPGLYRSAVSLELLHDFMLVHDDIIDKSELRRGEPSMHRIFNRYLCRYKNLRFSGQDLTIVAGDVMYAMALDAFLAIKENPARKEQALKKLISAALYTGSGEFIELLSGMTDLNRITRKDIFQIYDLKTANYTFASPLSIGATLAGASKKELNKLFAYGTLVGRAFQIKDDIIGIFGRESETGKSNLTDIKEGKKTLLIWHTYNNADKKQKLFIKNTFSKKDISSADFKKIRELIFANKALDETKKEINLLLLKAQRLIKSSKINSLYKEPLHNYIKAVLSL
ncbi:MAG: polyprenyl synthetase family protein [Candidatus Omnitrophica bacterium]|nr:polyprenyl synthetase family protein [Candidatus Omnitrophota bacterium]